ncbi:MAG: DNA polymerase III subunit beta [Treponema sp.]|nr:DNA polymerase III subunit beta [Candidatus Treponema equifaecale]
MISEISIAQEIISTKNALSVLSNVLLIAEGNTLTIKATDIKVNFQTKIPVEIQEEGSTTVLCDKFMGILSALPEGEIEFAIQDKDNLVSAVIRHTVKKIKFQLNCTSQDKFPEIAIAEKVSFFEVPAKELKQMISQTSFAVSEDETRYFMNGVFFEKKEDKLVLVATDGRRLAYCEKPVLAGVAEFPSAIVHPKILNIVAKHASDEGNIEVAIVDKMIFFNFGNYEFSATLIDGQFPNYQRVIPETQSNKFSVLKSEFVSALKRISIMLDKTGRITLTMAPGVLTINSKSNDLGDAKEEIPCQYAGEEVSISMNYKHIDSPLKVMESEYITFEFTEILKAVTLRPEPAQDYFHVVMPMSVE